MSIFNTQTQQQQQQILDLFSQNQYQPQDLFSQQLSQNKNQNQNKNQEQQQIQDEDQEELEEYNNDQQNLNINKQQQEALEKLIQENSEKFKEEIEQIKKQIDPIISIDCDNKEHGLKKQIICLDPQCKKYTQLCCPECLQDHYHHRKHITIIQLRKKLQESLQQFDEESFKNKEKERISLIEKYQKILKELKIKKDNILDIYDNILLQITKKIQELSLISPLDFLKTLNNNDPQKNYPNLINYVKTNYIVSQQNKIKVANVVFTKQQQKILDDIYKKSDEIKKNSSEFSQKIKNICQYQNQYQEDQRLVYKQVVLSNQLLDCIIFSKYEGSVQGNIFCPANKKQTSINYKFTVNSEKKCFKGVQLLQVNSIESNQLTFQLQFINSNDIILSSQNYQFDIKQWQQDQQNTDIHELLLDQNVELEGDQTYKIELKCIQGECNILSTKDQICIIKKIIFSY